MRIKPEVAAKRDKAIVASWEKSGGTKTYRQIGREVGCSASVVSRAINAHAGPQRAPGAGRPRKPTETAADEPEQLELPDFDADDPEAVRRLATEQMEKLRRAEHEHRRKGEDAAARQASDALLKWAKMWQELAPPPEKTDEVTVDRAEMDRYGREKFQQLDKYRRRLREKRDEKRQWQLEEFEADRLLTAEAREVLRRIGWTLPAMAKAEQDERPPPTEKAGRGAPSMEP